MAAASRLEKTKRIISPAKTRSEHPDDPFVLVVSSPHEDPDTATGYKDAIGQAESRGYKSIFNAELTWHEQDLSRLTKRDMRSLQGKPLTLWLEAHGAPCWFFGPTPGLEIEIQAAQEFAQFAQRVSAELEMPITNVLINSCFSAAEIMDSDSSYFTVSPARMLSILLADTYVVGFNTKNDLIRMSGLYDSAGTELAARLSIDNTCLFRGGIAIEWGLEGSDIEETIYLSAEKSYIKEEMITVGYKVELTQENLMIGPKVEYLLKQFHRWPAWLECPGVQTLTQLVGVGGLGAMDAWIAEIEKFVLGR